MGRDHRRGAVRGTAQLDGEGLVEAVREEQVGRRPARTVYQITQEGRLELVVQRDAALEVVFGPADPLSVVLLFAAGRTPRNWASGWRPAATG